MLLRPVSEGALSLPSHGVLHQDLVQAILAVFVTHGEKFIGCIAVGG